MGGSRRPESTETMHSEHLQNVKLGWVFFGWFVAFMVSMAFVGLIPTSFVFIVAYMRLENSEPWRLTLPLALSNMMFMYVVFDYFLGIPWPATVIGNLIPALKIIPSI